MLSLEEKAELLLLAKQRELVHARDSFEAFISYVMPTFDWNWHHRIIASRLSQLPHQKKQRLLISVPAQTGKSELVSRKLPAWMLGTNPDCKIILGSYGTTFASGFNRANQKLMDTNDYQDVFPHTRLNTRNMRTMSGVAKRTGDHFEVVGRSGFLRTVGHGAGSSGYPADLLIVDDPYPDMRSALSKTYRERVQSWFTSVGIMRLSKNAHVVILHTRWHEDDLIGWLKKKAVGIAGLGEFEELRFPSIADDDLHPLDPRKPNEPLWPSWKGTTEELLGKKHLIGDFVFSAMEQQKPPKLAGGIIDITKFQRFTSGTLPRDFDFIFTSWDLNYGESEQKDSDYACGYVVGYKAPNIYILAQYHGRYEFTEAINHMEISQSLWNAAGVLVEKKANGAAAINTLKQKLSGVMPFEPGTRDKVTRAISCAPEINGGNVWFPLEPWVDDALIEFGEFPEADHDDRVDALTQAILWLRESKGKMGMKKLMDYYGGKL